MVAARDHIDNVVYASAQPLAHTAGKFPRAYYCFAHFIMVLETLETIVVQRYDNYF
jgi:hypothetical protein